MNHLKLDRIILHLLCILMLTSNCISLRSAATPPPAPATPSLLHIEKVPVYAALLKKQIALLRNYLRAVEVQIEKQMARDQQEEQHCARWRATMEDRIDQLEQAVDAFSSLHQQELHTHDQLLSLITAITIIMESFERSVRTGFHSKHYRIPGSLGLERCQEYIDTAPIVENHFLAVQEEIAAQSDIEAYRTSFKKYSKKGSSQSIETIYDPYMRLIESMLETSSTTIPRAISTYRKNIFNIWISDLKEACFNSYWKITYDDATWLSAIPLTAATGILWKMGIIPNIVANGNKMLTEVIRGACLQAGQQGISVMWQFAKGNLVKVSAAALKRAEGYPVKASSTYGFQQIIKEDQVCIISPEYTIIIDSFKDFLHNLKKGVTLQSKSFCLTGDPGVGKTYQLKHCILPEIDALAKEAGFAGAAAMEITESFLNEGELSLMRLTILGERLFQEHNILPIYFCDEIATYRLHENGDDAKSRIFLSFINQLPSGSLFIGATNNPEAIRADMFRPGRFSGKIHLQLPTVSDLQQTLKQKCLFYKVHLSSECATAIAALMKNGPQSTMAAVDTIASSLITLADHGTITHGMLRDHKQSSAIIASILTTSHSIRPLTYEHTQKTNPKLAELRASFLLGQLLWHYTENRSTMQKNIWKSTEHYVKKTETMLRDRATQESSDQPNSIVGLQKPFCVIATLDTKVTMVPSTIQDVNKGHKEVQHPTLCLPITAYGAQATSGTFHDLLADHLSALAGIVMQETHNNSGNNHEPELKHTVITKLHTLLTTHIIGSKDINALPPDMKEAAQKEATTILTTLIASYAAYAQKKDVQKAIDILKQNINPKQPIITSDDLIALEEHNACASALAETNFQQQALALLAVAAKKIHTRSGTVAAQSTAVP